MNTVSILVTVVIINWNFRGPRTHSMPNWIRVVFIKVWPPPPNCRYGSFYQGMKVMLGTFTKAFSQAATFPKIV